MWYWFFKNVVFGPLVAVVVRPRVSGMQHVPAEGGALIAANHTSAWETLILPARVPRRVTFPAKAELFVGRGGLKSRIVAWFLTAIGQVPMDRRGGSASDSGLEPLKQALRDGALVGIFPEGTRSPDGNLYRGKTGVARLALACDVPVIPVGLVNTEPTRGLLGLPRFHRPRIRVGEPISYSQWAGQGDDRAIVRWVTDDVMAHIQALSGQQYFECNGSSVKRGSLTTEQRDSYARETPHTGKPLPPGASA